MPADTLVKPKTDSILVARIILKILVAHKNNNFDLFVKRLLILQKETSKLNPEDMHLDFVDFLMDENMWNWAHSSLNKNPTEYDLEAVDFVASDLQDLLANNKIFK